MVPRRVFLPRPGLGIRRLARGFRLLRRMLVGVLLILRRSRRAFRRTGTSLLGQAGATYQLGQLQQEYGYGETGAANPYSRAALLQESFQRSKLGTTNNYAAGGQLYSGAYGRAQGENQRQYSIGENANRRAYDQAVYGVNYGQAQNAATYGTGMDDAAFEACLGLWGSSHASF
jgi:hypothetical protein